MKILAWYCVFISSLLAFMCVVDAANMASVVPWYVPPISKVASVIYALFFWLAALNRNISIPFAYTARVANVFFGIIFQIGLIFFFINFKVIDIFLYIMSLPLLYYCEKKVRIILGGNVSQLQNHKSFGGMLRRKDVETI